MHTLTIFFAAARVLSGRRWTSGSPHVPNRSLIYVLVALFPDNDHAYRFATVEGIRASECLLSFKGVWSVSLWKQNYFI